MTFESPSYISLVLWRYQQRDQCLGGANSIAVTGTTKEAVPFKATVMLL